MISSFSRLIKKKLNDQFSWTINGELPSGKRFHSELENHHAINGKTHYFYGHVHIEFFDQYIGT